MKKIFLILVIGSLFLTSCAYESAYREYATAQKIMAMQAGNLVDIDIETGKVKAVGNPLIAVAMMQMKPPKSEAEAFFDWLKVATPFGVIWGIVGSLGGSSGPTTNVSGTGNYTGNLVGNQSPATFGSPPTTTVTTVSGE